MAVNVVVCGMIRSLLEANLIFVDLACGRAEGRIDRLVYCTWDDHLTELGPIPASLAALGVEIIGVKKPQGNDSFLMQVVPFYSALASFESDDFVARVRTDKCYPFVRRLLANTDELLAKCQAANEGDLFDGKIVVPALSLNELFAHSDFLMLGKVSDLRKLCHFDLYYDLFCEDVVPEVRWFSKPYIDRYDDFRTVFENVSIISLCEALKSWSTSDPAEPLPSPVAKFLAKYIALCARDFSLMDDGDEHKSLDLPGALAGRDPTGWQWGQRVFVTQQGWIDRIAAGVNLGTLTEFISEARHSKPQDRQLGDDEVIVFQDFIGRYRQHPASASRKPLRIKPSASKPASSRRDEFVLALLRSLTFIDPGFDPAILSEDIIDAALTVNELDRRDYSHFAKLCRVAGDNICDLLRARYGEDVPAQALIVPALFFACSLTYAWDGAAGGWLADQLLENRLSRKFASLTRWGLTARWWIQNPDVMAKAAMLMALGIGGPVAPVEAQRIMDVAASRGSAEAAAYLKSDSLHRPT